MRKKLFAVLLGLGALAMFAGVAAAQPTGQSAGGVRGEAQLDLVVSVPITPGGSPATDLEKVLRSLREFQVDSFFDIEYARVAPVSNIGSSGLDGVRASSFQVDSFFDVSYQIFGDPDFDMLRVSATGVLADPANPGAATDAVRRAAEKLGGSVFYGHVTVLK